MENVEERIGLKMKIKIIEVENGAIEERSEGFYALVRVPEGWNRIGFFHTFYQAECYLHNRKMMKK